jgi:XTP/dITP diphosphohydrolase
MLKKLVIASGNAGKVREIELVLAPLGIACVTQASIGVPEAEEPHCTFIENALAKARHASRLTALPALADDSGICVQALGGAPGVRSARYATERRGNLSQDEQNNRKLLHALEGRVDRRAHYYCVIVVVRHAEDPEPLIAEGEWHGEVALTPRGSGGFGYDPLFVIPGLGKTGAELDLAQKNGLSHRGQALERLALRLASLGVA